MKTKITLLILNSAFLILNCSAQTNVSGFINANTTWDLAGSPYIVTGNILLFHGYTLTIEPGVIVKFDTATVLQIDGELIAIGTQQARIIFTSNQSNPAAGDWGKIQFSDTCVDASFDLNGNYISGSIMKYCDILYAGRIGFGAIHLARSSPYLTNCKIAFSSSDGIYCFQQNFFIDSSAVKSCNNYGISFNCIPYNASPIYIYADTIEDNANCGIYIGTGSCVIQSLTVKNCYFFSNHYMGALYCYSSFQSGAITENTFISNTTNYLYGGIVYLPGARDYIFNCNRFINNQSGGVGTLSIGNYLSGPANYIVNNLFQGNTSLTGYPVIDLYSGPTSPGQNTFIMNNHIENNYSSAYPCFRIISNYSIANNHYTDYYIENNNFINNNAPSFFSFGAPANPNSGNNFIHLKHNNFLNPLCQLEVTNAIPFSDPNIEADSNYWGTTNTQHIDSVIYDFFDLGNLSVVFYSPPLSSPASVDTTCTSIITEINTIGTSEFISRFFPNPFSEQATIKFSCELHSATFRLYNLYGQMLQERNSISGREIILSRENLVSGVYVFEVMEKGNKIYSGKAVVY